MDKKTEPKMKTVTITLQQGSFPVILYANRCGVEDLDGNKVVVFGFAHGPGRREEVFGVFACLFDRLMLQSQRESWLKYLAEVGYADPPAPMEWNAPADRVAGFPVVNSAAFCRSGEDAEIRCFNYAMGDISGAGDTSSTQNVMGQSVALIRCTTDLQRNFLLTLFDAL